jgi:ribosomal protein S18 acetylase RimI-like enzyme
MAFGNETPPFTCRFLNESHFDLVLEKFLEAFADYPHRFEFDSVRFRNHINLNAVDLERSVGCFVDAELVGFTLNGFGEWNGRPTVYDAGTGVVPKMRRRGVSEAMFDLMLPEFASSGARQLLLEVIVNNEPAVRLYSKLGFKVNRDLLLLEAPRDLKIMSRLNPDIEVRPVQADDLSYLTALWDGEPSWQNSNAAVKRSESLKTIFGAFLAGRFLGYIVFSTGLGRIAQLFVVPSYRNQGVGTRLLAAMNAEMKRDSAMQVLNIDKSMTGAVHFFESLGFREILAQHEMIKPLV